jgi:hypothetical protein
VIVSRARLVVSDLRRSGRIAAGACGALALVEAALMVVTYPGEIPVGAALRLAPVTVALAALTWPLIAGSLAVAHVAFRVARAALGRGFDGPALCLLPYLYEPPPTICPTTSTSTRSLQASMILRQIGPGCPAPIGIPSIDTAGAAQ